MHTPPEWRLVYNYGGIVRASNAKFGRRKDAELAAKALNDAGVTAEFASREKTEEEIQYIKRLMAEALQW